MGRHDRRTAFPQKDETRNMRRLSIFPASFSEGNKTEADQWILSAVVHLYSIIIQSNPFCPLQTDMWAILFINNGKTRGIQKN